MNAVRKSRRNPAYPEYERAVNEAWDLYQAGLRKLEDQLDREYRALDEEWRAALLQLSPTADAGERQAINRKRGVAYQRLMRKINAAERELQRQNRAAWEATNAAYWAAVAQQEKTA